MLFINNNIESKIELDCFCNFSNYFYSMLNGSRFLENLNKNLNINLPTVKNKEEWIMVENMIINFQKSMNKKWNRLCDLYQDFNNNWMLYYIISIDIFPRWITYPEISILQLKSDIKVNISKLSNTGLYLFMIKLIEIMMIFKRNNIKIIDEKSLKIKKRPSSLAASQICFKNFPKYPVGLLVNFLKDGKSDSFTNYFDILTIKITTQKDYQSYRNDIDNNNNNNIYSKFYNFRFKKNDLFNEIKDYNPLVIIHTFNYLQINILDIYIENLKKYLLTTKYNVIKDNARLVCCLVDSVENILNDSSLDYIFNFKINSEYLTLGKKIICYNDISSETKSQILLHWSKNFNNLEKLTGTLNQYFEIDMLNNNGFNLPNNSNFIDTIHKKTFWGQFIENLLPNNCLLAGGFIPLCLKDLPTQKYNDIDIWIFGNDSEKTFNILIKIIKRFLRIQKKNEYYITINKSIVSIHLKNEMSLQLIYTDKKNPIDIISNFDFDYLQSFYLNNKLYLSTQSIKCYTTSYTNFLKDFKNISPTRIMKTLEKGFKIQNLENIIPSEDLLKNNENWIYSKNKYFDEYSDNLDRNNFLLKKIYQAEFIVNNFDELNIYFDYIPFKQTNYLVISNDYNNYNFNKISILNINEKIQNKNSYISFEKSLLLKDNPIMNCNFVHENGDNIILKLNTLENKFIPKFIKIMNNIKNSINNKYNINVNFNPEMILDNNSFLCLYLDKKCNCFKLNNLLVNPLKDSFKDKYLKFDILIKGINIYPKNNEYYIYMDYRIINCIIISNKEYKSFNNLLEYS